MQRRTSLLSRARLVRPRALASLCILLLATGTASAEWAGQEVVENGVVRVQNSAMPMNPALELQLEELWRLGGDSEEEGEFFGLITDIAVEPSGDVYLLDRQLSEVKVFSGDGEYLRTIGREGEGPGEFRRPSALFLTPDGNVAVVQSRPSGITMLTPDGDPLEPYPMPNSDDGGFRSVQGGRFRGGSLILLGFNFRRSEGSFERTVALVRMDMQGKETARFHEDTRSSNMASFVIREKETSQMPWAVRPDGGVVASLDFNYRINLWSADGTLARVITRDYKSRVRGNDDKEKRKEELGSSIRIRGRRSRPTITVEVEDKDRDVQWLEVADDGSLWVLSSRGALDAPEGTIGTFDVFDRDGRYLQAVTLAGDASFEDDRIILAGDRLFVIKEFAAALRAMRGTEVDDEELVDEEDVEPMSVICYRFQWAPPRAVAVPTN